MSVRIVAVCDVDRAAREATAKRFAIPRAYADAGRMLEAEKIDVLYSLVRVQPTAPTSKHAPRRRASTCSARSRRHCRWGSPAPSMPPFAARGW